MPYLKYFECFKVLSLLLVFLKALVLAIGGKCINFQTLNYSWISRGIPQISNEKCYLYTCIDTYHWFSELDCLT